MSKGSTKAKADAPSASKDHTKGQLTKAGAKTGGIAGGLVRMDDDTCTELETALGTKNISFNTNLFVRAVRTAFVFQGEDVHAGAEDMLNQTATLVAIKAFKPTDPVEAMLAAQAVMLHNLAMEAGRRAQSPQQHADVASKLRKDAANSARAMVDMCEALDRRRGKGGQQRIVVERVQVAPGGHAIVGAVTAGAPLLASSLPALDAESVVAGQGEGERDAGADG